MYARVLASLAIVLAAPSGAFGAQGMHVVPVQTSGVDISAGVIFSLNETGSVDPDSDVSLFSKAGLLVDLTGQYAHDKDWFGTVRLSFASRDAQSVLTQQGSGGESGDSSESAPSFESLVLATERFAVTWALEFRGDDKYFGGLATVEVAWAETSGFEFPTTSIDGSDPMDVASLYPAEVVEEVVDVKVDAVGPIGPDSDSPLDPVVRLSVKAPGLFGGTP